MTRVSPPELAREFPGPHASSNVTFAPFFRSSRAVQPPNAPAPTTTIDFREELANARDPIRYAPAAPELVKKVRRELLLMKFMENSSNWIFGISQLTLRLIPFHPGAAWCSRRN